MTRRARRTTPARACRLDDAGLVLSRRDAPPVVRGLSVAAAAEGLTVVSPTGRAITTIPWSDVTSLGGDGPSDGAPAGAVGWAGGALTVEVGDRRHRFLAPAPDVEVFVAGARALWCDAVERRAAAGTATADTWAVRAATPSPFRPVAATARRAVVRGALVLTALTLVPLGPRRRRPAHGTGALWVSPHPSIALGGALFRSPPRRAPLHAAPRRRRRGAGRRDWRITPVMACAVAFFLVAGGATLGALTTGGAVAATQAPPGADAGEGQSVSIMDKMAQAFAHAAPAAPLPAATAPPAPAPPSLAGAPALRAHEIFGFAPYWSLPEASSFDVAAMTTLAYFSVDVNGDASIVESGPGWTGYQSQDLADLVTRAHAAGARVVLTATCFGQKQLAQLAADPTAGGRLGASLVQLVQAKNLDGVNVDFEGQGPQDRAGLDTLMAAVSAAVHQANPHWQVTMDTYASSAGDPEGFYDIAGLAPSVDAFFVMAYDMNSPAVPSPTAPLTGTGFTDLDAVQQYVAAVGPDKVILGVPYYGYDWPTAGPGLGDPAAGPATPLSYAQVVADGGHLYWDPITETPWTSYQVGTQWHQTFFDDPTSLALKAQLVNTYRIAGVGIWALGMEGGDATMLGALRGTAPVVKNLPKGPAATVHPTSPSTTTAPPTYFYSGSWNGAPVTLTTVDPGSIPAGGTTADPAPLVGFATNDPAELCLENGPALSVGALSGSPGVYVVTAAPPGDCAGGTWEFTTSPPSATSPPAPLPASTTTTSTTAAATTTTSSVGTTSTTSTTAPGG